MFGLDWFALDFCKFISIIDMDDSNDFIFTGNRMQSTKNFLLA